MQRQTSGQERLFIFGGDSLRFLIEKPILVYRNGLQVVSVDRESDFDVTFRAAADAFVPACLVVCSERLPEDAPSWVTNQRSRYPWLPIIIVGHPLSRHSWIELIPHSRQCVSTIRQPYTQKAVFDTIDKSIGWSRTLFLMLERIDLFEKLSERELAIVSMATDGVPNKAMARRLEVSIKTIEKNRRSAYQKLEISCSAEMAALITFRRYFTQTLPEECDAVTTIKLNISPSVSAQLQ